MTILKHLRRRPSPEHGDHGSEEAGSAGGQVPGLPGYDKLGDKQVVERLAGLSQVELAEAEAYERSHGGRPSVLQKLRYLRRSEPLEGYDALGTDAVIQALAGADAQTVRAVRDYERMFQRRQAVLDETARLLPSARASAGEDRARDEKAARTRDGYAGRKQALADGEKPAT